MLTAARFGDTRAHLPDPSKLLLEKGLRHQHRS
jgi:hypothetical protein